ncbi:MAG: hypothetical protein AAF500_20650 [Myxococcota bacterium]
MLRAVDGATDKPVDFLERVRGLMEEPSVAAAAQLLECIRRFRDWGVSDIDAYTWFMTEVEWSWMRGTVPIEDW